MKYQRVALIGGSGFVGSHLTHRLRNAGYQCRVLTRHAFRHADLRLSAQVRAVDPYQPAELALALEGCDAVVNLVGILHGGKRGRNFRTAHVRLTETIVETCHQTGIKRLLHMSALHADQATGSSEYLRSKGEGENRAHTLGKPDIAVTSFRPSVIFGPGDSFLNRFAGVLKIPGPLPLACWDTRFSPVYIDDVVEAFTRALPRKDTHGKHYDLCGPEIFTLEEIVRLVGLHTRRDKTVLRLPDWAARLQASVLQHVPGKPFTPDNYLSLQTDSVCSQNGLGDLGITPTAMKPLLSELLSRS